MLKKILIPLALFILILNCKEDPVKVETGTIKGVVYDYKSGEIVPKAHIFTIPPTGSVTSDTLTGEFKILHVDPGTYSVYGRKTGYDSSNVNITIIADDITIADLALMPDSTQKDTSKSN